MSRFYSNGSAFHSEAGRFITQKVFFTIKDQNAGQTRRQNNIFSFTDTLPGQFYNSCLGYSF
jgi:hypothetical protein